MNKNQELERGVIPAGTRVKLFEGRVTLLEDVTVDANQEWIDKAIQDQDSYFKGISRSGDTPKDSRESGGSLSESLSLQGEKEFAENGSISCKNSIDR